MWKNISSTKLIKRFVKSWRASFSALKSLSDFDRTEHGHHLQKSAIDFPFQKARNALLVFCSDCRIFDSFPGAFEFSEKFKYSSFWNSITIYFSHRSHLQVCLFQLVKTLQLLAIQSLLFNYLLVIVLTLQRSIFKLWEFIVKLSQLV